MSVQDAYEKLGVTENSSFDEIQQAKQRLGQEYQNDSKQLEGVETAYDAIIMDRLKKRQEGKIKVPEGIRFPERKVEKTQSSSFNPIPANVSSSWLQRFIDTPDRNDILLPAGIYLALSVLAFLTPSSDGSSLTPLLLTLGFGGCVYFLNRKEKRFGRSLLLALGGLVIGVSLGALLFGLLEGQFSNMTVDQVSTVIAFLFFWLISSFLR